MKNSGLKNEAQVAKIFVSGSDALPAKNSAGVRLFKQSDLSDGIISGKLIRPNYNVKELKKSIDTEIFELLPNVPAPQPDTVPRPVYNGALEQIDDLTAEVQRLNVEVNDLSAKVSELEIVSESLKIEADNQTLTDIQVGWFVSDSESTIKGKALLFYPIKVNNGTEIRFLNDQEKK